MVKGSVVVAFLLTFFIGRDKIRKKESEVGKMTKILLIKSSVVLPNR